MEYSIIIPVICGHQSIPSLCSLVSDVFIASNSKFEIILVDDHSSDGSWEDIKKLVVEFTTIKGIRLAGTYGQHNATLCGLREARGDLIITMDEDLQHPPSQIKVLLDKLQESNAKVVYGVPKHDCHPWWRRSLVSIIMPLLHYLASFKFRASSFRLMRKEVVEQIKDVRRPDIIIDFHIGWATTDIVNAVIEHSPSARGSSSYTRTALIKQFFRILFGYILMPRKLRTSGRKHGVQYEISERTS